VVVRYDELMVVFQGFQWLRYLFSCFLSPPPTPRFCSSLSPWQDFFFFFFFFMIHNGKQMLRKGMVEKMEW
jgi:hypothetical protein